jgi:hypothetical protein
MEAFLRSFVESASPSELKSLRRAIRDRARSLRQNGKKGRPRAEESWDWICSTLKLIWEHDIKGKSWREIAYVAGIKPTIHTTRTFQKRRDHYAMLVWQALPGRTDDAKALSRSLEAKVIQRLLRSRVALPFDTHPEECKKLVLALAPRGLEVRANELNRIVNRRIAPKSAGPVAPRK